MGVFPPFAKGTVLMFGKDCILFFWTLTTTLLFAFSGDGIAGYVDFSWEYAGRDYDLSLNVDTLGICSNEYSFLPHPYPENNVNQYLFNDPCGDDVRRLAYYLGEKARENSLNRLKAVELALNMVRSIPYKYDQDSKNISNYYRYPGEMLLDQEGDCEDFAMLYVAILSHWCVDSMLIRIPGHIAVGINGSEFPDHNLGAAFTTFRGDDYWYAESTGTQEGKPAQVGVGDLRSLGDNGYPNPNEVLDKIRVPLFCTTPLDRQNHRTLFARREKPPSPIPPVSVVSTVNLNQNSHRNDGETGRSEDFALWLIELQAKTNFFKGEAERTSWSDRSNIYTAHHVMQVLRGDSE